MKQEPNNAKGIAGVTPYRLIAAISLLCGASTQAAMQDLAGYVEIGLRDVNSSGDEAKYRQHINEDSGARLFGLALSYAPDQAEGFAPDSILLDAYGIGGDPYQNAQLDVRKYGRYRVRYQRRESDYFYQDLLIEPEDIDIEASNEGDLHRFNHKRSTDRASVDVQLSPRAKLLLAYDRYRKTGDSTTVLDVQREEFELRSPAHQRSENFDVGFEYAWDKLTLSYHERWRDFDNSVSYSLSGPSEGLDLLGPTRLDFFFFNQPYRYDSREHQLGLRIRPTSRISLNLDVLSADLEMDVDSNENAQGIDYLGLPFQTSISTADDADRETEQIYFSGSFAFSQNLRFVTSVREQRLDQEARNIGAVGSRANNWNIDSNRVTVGLEAIPSSHWILAAGWSQQRRTVESRFASAASLTETRDTTQNNGYWGSVSYRPSKRIQWRASIEDNNIDDAYTSASATESRRYKLKGHYQFDNGVLLTATHLYRDHDNDVSDWQSDSRQTTLGIARSTPSLAMSLSYTRIDLDHEIDQLVRGGFRQDLFNIDYRADTQLWDASVEWSPNEKLSFAASHLNYRNRGALDSDRDDTRLSIGYKVAANYHLQVRYRTVDFKEPPSEQFESDTVELAVRYQR